MSNELATFGWVDYLVFALTLAISAAIGFYYAFSGKRQRSANEVFVGGRQMTLIPVTLSILASFMSAVSVLGTPAEIYTNGIVYVYIGISYLVAFPCAAHIFLPMFYRLDCVSAHEYLRLRFNEAVRVAASAIFVFQMLIYMAVVLYAPAVAFSQVSGLSMWLSIFVVGIVCSLYTAIGGIKAVIWTDSFQASLMFAGLLTIIIRGTIDVGGLDAVFSAAERGGRLNFLYLKPRSNATAEFDLFASVFNPSPLERHTIWTLIIGGSFMCGSIYCSNQAQIQRYLSCKSLRTAQYSLWLNIPVTWVMLAMFGMCGLVAYAVYEQCDPLLAKHIGKKDQLLPYFVMDKMNVPGIPGIFLACVLSAALSTVSSGLNSLATVSMVDIIMPLRQRCSSKRLSDSRIALISKILAISYGMLTIGLAFLTQYTGGMVLQIALSIFGTIGGPILGLFSTGMFFPFVDSIGAFVGLFVSLGVSMWISVGAIAVGGVSQPLPLSVVGCASNLTSLAFTSLNSTFSVISANTSQVVVASNVTSPGSAAAPGLLTNFYSISYLYYGAVAVLVCVVTSSLVSLFTGLNRRHPVDSRLYYPLFAKICFCIPRRQRSACCGESMHISYVAPNDVTEAKSGEIELETNANGQKNTATFRSFRLLEGSELQ